MDAFLSMGILVPILLSCIFYQEGVSVSQIIGLILLLGSVILMSLYNNQIKEKTSLAAALLLAFVGMANGFTDFSQKMFTNSGTDMPASVFSFYTYVVCAIVLFVFFLCLKDKTVQENELQNENGEVCEMGEKSEKPVKTAILDKQKLIYIAVMALFLFCNSYFKTLAAGRLSAVQLYPLSQGAAMILSLLMSAICFKEKIKPLCIVGMAVLFIGLLFLNVFVF